VSCASVCPGKHLARKHVTLPRVQHHAHSLCKSSARAITRRRQSVHSAAQHVRGWRTCRHAMPPACAMLEAPLKQVVIMRFQSACTDEPSCARSSRRHHTGSYFIGSSDRNILHQASGKTEVFWSEHGQTRHGSDPPELPWTPQASSARPSSLTHSPAQRCLSGVITQNQRCLSVVHPRSLTKPAQPRPRNTECPIASGDGGLSRQYFIEHLTSYTWGPWGV